MTRRIVSRHTLALMAAGAGLPVLAAVYQLAAVRLAHVDAGLSLRDWAGGLFHSPWGIVLLVAEGLSFALWMLALGELPLALAFPLTAMGSVLTLGLAAIVLGETVPPLAWIGIAAILGGAWLIVRPAR